MLLTSSTKIAGQLFICLTAMVFVGFKVNAAEQPYTAGYIVTMGKDTVRGFIQLRGTERDGKTCHFKESLTGAEVDYSADKIIAYGTDGKYFRSFRRLTPNGEEQFFVQSIFQGKLNLYYYGDENFFIESEGVIQELLEIKKEVVQNDRTFIIRQPLFRATLESLMNDCPTIHQEITKTVFQRRSLLNLMKKYHECVGAVIKGSETEEVTQIRIGVSVSALQSQLAWGRNFGAFLLPGSSTKATDYSYSPSFWVEWRGPSGKIRVRSGLNYYSVNYAAKTLDTSGDVETFNLKATRLELPVELRYFFSGRGLYIFGNAAISHFFTFDNSVQLNAGTNGPLLDSYTAPYHAQTLVPQVGAGLGYELILGKHIAYLQVDTRTTVGEFADPAAGFPLLSIKMFSATIGISLTKD